MYEFGGQEDTSHVKAPMKKLGWGWGALCAIAIILFLTGTGFMIFSFWTTDKHQGNAAGASAAMLMSMGFVGIVATAIAAGDW